MRDAFASVLDCRLQVTPAIPSRCVITGTIESSSTILETRDVPWRESSYSLPASRRMPDRYLVHEDRGR